jgi:PAS domain S-box-containing protein
MFALINAHTRIYNALALVLVLTIVGVTARGVNNAIEADLDSQLGKMLDFFSYTVDSGTTDSRAMGAAIYFGAEHRRAKQQVLGELRPGDPQVTRALEHLRALHFMDEALLIDAKGRVVASSGASGKHVLGDSVASFFYFRDAMTGKAGVHPTRLTAGGRGIFLSAPIGGKSVDSGVGNSVGIGGVAGGDAPLGVVALRMDAAKLDNLLAMWSRGPGFLLSPQGQVFATNRSDWLLRTLDHDELLPATARYERLHGLAQDAQAAAGPTQTDHWHETEIAGHRYVAYQQPLAWGDPMGVWKLVVLDERDPWWLRLKTILIAALSGVLAVLVLWWFFSLARINALRQQNFLALDTAQRRLRELTDNAPVAIFQATRGAGGGLEFRFVSHRVEDIVGISAEDLMQGRRGLFDQIVPEDRLASEAAITTALAGEQAWNVEFRVRFGEVTRWVNSVAYPLRGLDQVVNFNGYNEDVTARRESAEAMRSAKDMAEQAARIKANFLANMSHEIRTPMNSVIGMAHLALHSGLNQKQRDYVEKIQLSGQHLLGLIDDILDFSKIEAGKLALEAVDFELDAVIRNLANIIGERAESKGLTLVFDIDPLLAHPLRGDSLRLGQVLINLCSNAVKFTSHGGITVRARQTEAGSESCRLRFEVQDTGIGMTEEQMSRLFADFEQADMSTTRKFGGTGLGLAISKELVTLMGGEIGVDSRLRMGSTFWFTVRLGLGSAAELPAPCADEMPSGYGPRAVSAALNEARIVLAEDNQFNQQVASEMLQAAGAIVCVANNGKEVLNLLRQEAFDCVLMDVQMPEMDGFEATRRIRADPALAGIRVIAMTANASQADRAECLAAGMDDFISKPVQPERLYAKVTAVLAGRAGAVESSGAATRADERAEPPSAAESVIDLQVLAKMVDHDAIRMRKYAFKFVESAGAVVAEMETALAVRDTTTAARLGHRLKSSARTVGAGRFADLCQGIEACRHDADPAGVAGLVAQLGPLLAEISAQIELHFNQTEA